MPTSGRPTRVSPKEWQFVNVNDPNQNLDKGIISVVRAHAMRNVRRQQRLKLTTQYQESLNTKVPTRPPAYPKVAAEYLMPLARNDGSVDDEANIDSSREMDPGCELVDLVQTTSDWQIYRENEGQQPTSMALGIPRAASPRLMYPDGVFDPFNTKRTAICAWSNSQVLHHCKRLLS